MQGMTHCARRPSWVRVTTILSAKEMTVQSVGMPSIIRAACLVPAGKEVSNTVSILMSGVGCLKFLYLWMWN